jgi:hypothetical protein
MANLYYQLVSDELDDDEISDDNDLYEKEDFVDLDDLDLDADEDVVLCLQCGEVVEDGVQCTFCGCVVEVIKPLPEKNR